MIEVDKWKLSVSGKNGLEIRKSFPAVVFNVFDVEALLKADVYSIVKQRECTTDDPGYRLY